MMYGFRILLIIAALGFIAPGISARDRDDSTAVTDTTEVDNRPLLKRIFKDFPVVYTDTAYTAPDYVVVIKCTLVNHSWHHHSREKMKRERVYAIPDTADETTTAYNDSKPLVTFTSLPSNR